MANYYGTTKSNRFEVVDAEAFTAFLETVANDGNGVVLSEHKGPNEEAIFEFGCDGSICGIMESDGEDGVMPEGDYDDFLSQLQKHIAPNSVVVLTEVGHESLRYVSAYAEIITRNNIESIDLVGVAEERGFFMLAEERAKEAMIEVE